MSPSRKKQGKGGEERPRAVKKGRVIGGGNGFRETILIPNPGPAQKTMKLVVKPNWEDIEGVRKSSAEFLRSQGFSGDAVNALTMVISELIENGIKYGDFRVPESKVVLSIHVGKRMVTVEVINPVDETARDHLRRLDRTIQWIRGYQDPFQAYTERIREVSKKPLHDKESGLGLVRIAYEGKSILDFFLGEDSSLSVSAVSVLEEDYGR